jgi:hypothetical protein
MAETIRTNISFPIQDELGITATCALYAFMDGSTTLANMVTEYQATSVLLDAITGGKLSPGTWTVTIDPDAGVKGSPAAGSRVEQTGVFDFTDVVVGRAWGQAVAALADSKIVSGRINDADTDIVAWVANLLAAITTGHYSNPNMQHLGAVRDTFISFRKHRTALTRESYSTS